MDPANTVLGRLHDYVGKVKEIDYALEHTNGSEDYEARINKTLQFLQKQVKQQKDALEKVLFLIIGDHQYSLTRMLSYEPQTPISWMNHLLIPKSAFDSFVRSQQRTSLSLQPSRSSHWQTLPYQPFWPCAAH